MSPNQYFRAGVGAVLYNEANQIFIFNRSDIAGLWQFPQGGLDTDEDPISALWRELEEETGLTETSIDLVTPYPTWLYYEYQTELRHTLRDPNCLGQIHRWYFLKIKPGVTVDLNLASHKEFSDFKLATFTDLLKQEDTLKQAVFKTLSEYFKNLP